MAFFILLSSRPLHNKKIMSYTRRDGALHPVNSTISSVATLLLMGLYSTFVLFLLSTPQGVDWILSFIRDC